LKNQKKREITTNLFKRKHQKNIGKERNLARRGHFAKEVLFVVIFYTANRNFKVRKFCVQPYSWEEEGRAGALGFPS
jgi:hypothetical protein